MRRSDAALMERWISARDPEAFAELVDRHAAMVLATCRRVLGNQADAEETAQDCFLQVSQADRAIVPSLGGWLHRVATNRALDRVRSDTRRKAREEDYAASRPTTEEPVWNDIQPHVDEIIAQLPDDLQTPLILHFFEGQTHREVAKGLGLSRSTVTGRIQKAIGEIRTELDARRITIGATALATLFANYETPALSPTAIAPLKKIGLAAGRPVKPAGQRLGVQLGLAAAAMVVVLSVVWVTVAGNIGRSNASIPTPGAEVTPSTPVPAETLASTDPPNATVAAQAFANPENDSAMVIPESEEGTSRLRCVNEAGEPVEGAEVYYVHSERHVPPMTESRGPDDFIQKPYGPVLSDAEGIVEVPEIPDDGNKYGTLYSAYVRVPDKLVGVWTHSPRVTKKDGWNDLTLVATTAITGQVIVPAHFDPTKVVIKILSLRIRTGDVGIGAYLSVSSKYNDPVWPELFSTSPDRDGTFTLKDLPAGQSCYLEFTAPGLGEAQFYTFNVSPDEKPTVELFPEAVISGTVRNTNGGPVANAPVFARPFGGANSGIGVTTSFQGNTDAFGRYKITGLPREVYSVKVQHYGTPPEWISGVITSMEVETGATYDKVDFLVERGALQEGVVLEEESGAPVAGVGLVAMNPGDTDSISISESIGMAETDASGKFSFRLPTGVSFLYFFGGTIDYVPPKDQGRTYITVAPGESIKSPLEFRLTKKSEEQMEPVGEATVEGRVVDFNGEALAGVPVKIGRKYKHGDDDRQDQLPFRPTDKDGRFSVTVRATGEHQIVVGGDRFSQVESDWFSVKAAENKTLADFVVECYEHTIAVTVFNFSDEPRVSLPYVGVQLRDEDENITGGSVDRQGRITLHVPDAPLSFYVGQRGFKTVRADIDPGFAIDVELEPEGEDEGLSTEDTTGAN